MLAHDTGSDDRLITIDRLPAIIRRLRDDGYTFATVSDLLREQQGQRHDGEPQVGGPEGQALEAAHPRRPAEAQHRTRPPRRASRLRRPDRRPRHRVARRPTSAAPPPWRGRRAAGGRRRAGPRRRAIPAAGRPARARRRQPQSPEATQSQTAAAPHVPATETRPQQHGTDRTQQTEGDERGVQQPVPGRAHVDGRPRVARRAGQHPERADRVVAQAVCRRGTGRDEQLDEHVDRLHEPAPQPRRHPSHAPTVPAGPPRRDPSRDPGHLWWPSQKRLPAGHVSLRSGAHRTGSTLSRPTNDAAT